MKGGRPENYRKRTAKALKTTSGEAVAAEGVITIKTHTVPVWITITQHHREVMAKTMATATREVRTIREKDREVMANTMVTATRDLRTTKEGDQEVMAKTMVTATREARTTSLEGEDHLTQALTVAEKLIIIPKMGGCHNMVTIIMDGNITSRNSFSLTFFMHRSRSLVLKQPGAVVQAVSFFKANY